MASFYTCNSLQQNSPNKVIEISSEDEDNIDQNFYNIIEPSPIPSLEEFLGQTYRIFYGGEYHPNYDHQLGKFIAHLVDVPELEAIWDDKLEDDHQLLIDEDSSVEVVIDEKVLFADENDSEIDRAEMETASLIQQIHVILYEKDKNSELEEVVHEE